MANRSFDWLRQAERDPAQAEDSWTAERHEWAFFAATHLPVPADVPVYAEEEWTELGQRGARFHEVAAEEGVWVWPDRSSSS